MSPDEAAAFVKNLRASGIKVTLDAGRLSVGPWSEVEQLERAALVANVEAVRREVMAALAAESVEDVVHRAGDDRDGAGAEAADLPVDDVRDDVAPRVYVAGQRVTRGDVVDCLRGESDQALDSFEAGEMPAAEAYAMTARWLTAQLEVLDGKARLFEPASLPPAAPIFSPPPRAPTRRHQHVEVEKSRRHYRPPVLR